MGKLHLKTQTTTPPADDILPPDGNPPAGTDSSLETETGDITPLEGTEKPAESIETGEIPPKTPEQGDIESPAKPDLEAKIDAIQISLNKLLEIFSKDGALPPETGEVDEVVLAGESKPSKRWIPKIDETEDQFIKRTGMNPAEHKYWNRAIRPDLLEQLPENFNKF